MIASDSPGRLSTRINAGSWICYRENWCGVYGLEGGRQLRSHHREGLFVIPSHLLAELDGFLSLGAFLRGHAALLNRRFQTGKEDLARFAAGEVPLQFLAKRIIQLFVEIVREFSKHGLAAGRSGLLIAWLFLGRRPQGNGALPRAWFQPFHQFLPDKQPRTM